MPAYLSGPCISRKEQWAGVGFYLLSAEMLLRLCPPRTLKCFTLPDHNLLFVWWFFVQNSAVKVIFCKLLCSLDSATPVLAHALYSCIAFSLLQHPLQANSQFSHCSYLYLCFTYKESGSQRKQILKLT